MIIAATQMFFTVLDAKLATFQATVYLHRIPAEDSAGSIFEWRFARSDTFRIVRA